MYFLKRLTIYLVIILLIISLYKDVTKGMIPFNDSKSDHFQQIYTSNSNKDLATVAVRVQPGDTLLSIIEQINGQTNTVINMEQMILDFQALNPHTDPFYLEPNSIYYFRKY